MSSLSGILPEPKYSQNSNSFSPKKSAEKESESAKTSSSAPQRNIPPYGNRQNWVPKTLQDFGDGGAYPEILVGQYPLKMGLKKAKKVQTLSKQIDSQGNVKYDAIVRYGHGEDRIIQSEFKDLVPLKERLDSTNDNVIHPRPDDQSVIETAQRTREALEKKINGKLAAAKPRNNRTEIESGATFIRYTPNPDGPGYSKNTNQRIIRMSEMSVDPMEPPKFRHKRVPAAPPSPPPPVLHSPPRPVSIEEQKAWVIPPSISNWKNAKGYTIPLDKRLAADGRGLQEVKINDNFAKLSEALLAAERHAREEVRQRTLLQQNLARKEKESKEEHLRMLAQRAREERSGVNAFRQSPQPQNTEPQHGSDNNSAYSSSETEYDSRKGVSERGSSDGRAKFREEVRKDTRRELRKELRMSRMGAEAKAKYISRMENRDISEKIALGLAKPSNPTGDSMFDSRLIHRNESAAPNLNDDESYNIYDKPLLRGSNANANYRPRVADEDEIDPEASDSIAKSLENDRFGFGYKPDADAKESSRDKRKHKAEPVRQTPVEFEKGDIFGVDKFLNEAKMGLKRPKKD
ncbi:hypothetical protein BB560_003725 [Smittium megazygosporum]|uniref:Pre-mRNA-processing protein 45 n=1 Tax=Smittium megazygosporum TaxID=133381 RepID=A0A2T9ZB71_9FUNG|nr:hypothetical protein BB560_003725 [Smittium megazygosporum]